MSIVKSITVTGPNDITIITVGTQGAAVQGQKGEQDRRPILLPVQRVKKAKSVIKVKKVN